MKKETTRLYKIADADLKQLADDLKDSATRDAAAFATRNVGTAQLTTFETLIEDFANFPTDIELLGLVTDATEKKNAVVKEVHLAIRPIENMASRAYKGSGKYRVFGFAGMTELSDSKLIQMARRVARISTTSAPELAAHGYKPEQATQLSALAEKLDKATDAIRAAEETRDWTTQDRIEKGNALYAELVSLADTGKSLFADTDEARYNDYVLIGSKATPATTGQPA